METIEKWIERFINDKTLLEELNKEVMTRQFSRTDLLEIILIMNTCKDLIESGGTRL